MGEENIYPWMGTGWAFKKSWISCNISFVTLLLVLGIMHIHT